MSDPTRPDLLERFAALGVGQHAFEQANGLRYNLIACMKMGKSASPEALQAFEEAIAAAEAGTPAPPAPKNLGGRPPKIGTLSEEDKALRRSLASSISGAKDIDAVDQCNKDVSVALLDGVISDTTARVLKELLAERRNSLKARLEAEERAKAGQETIIRVVLVRGWTGGPLPHEVPR